jgi:hypothetical protein
VLNHSGLSGAMKDIKKQEFEALMVGGESAREAVARLDVALKFIFEDEVISMHDKVAGDFDFEELVAALILARDLLNELDE